MCLCGAHRNTFAFYFHRFREIITLKIEAEATEVLGGEIEADESYFGGKRKGRRGRGSQGKIPVFGEERFIRRSLLIFLCYINPNH